MEKLNSEEIHRYARHITLPEVGQAGQTKLKNSKALVVGAGGLGSPVALYLAAAGVGSLGLVDFDMVDLTNLQRQILHSTEMVGRPKLESAKERLEGLNPHTNLILHEERLKESNVAQLIQDYDVVIDGTDNFTSRYLANDACFMSKIPLVSGAILSFEGQLSVYNYQNGPCYRCLYPEPPPPEAAPNCAEAGVLGVLPGVIGVMQATEALKILLNIGQVCSGTLLHYDALAMSTTRLRINKDDKCPLCSKSPSITEIKAIAQVCAAPTDREISCERLSKNLFKTILVDVRKDHEREICSIDNSLHIPLDELEERIGEIPIDPERPVVFHCKLGGRSLKALDIFESKGLQGKSLAGGILAWIDKIDPSQKKY